MSLEQHGEPPAPGNQVEPTTTIVPTTDLRQRYLENLATLTETMQPKGTIYLTRRNDLPFAADCYLFGSHAVQTARPGSDWDVLLVPHQPIDSSTNEQGEPTKESSIAIVFKLYGMRGEGIREEDLENAVRQQLGCGTEAKLDLFLAVAGPGGPAVRLNSWDDHFAAFLDGLSTSTDPEMLAYRAERPALKARWRAAEIRAFSQKTVTGDSLSEGETAPPPAWPEPAESVSLEQAQQEFYQRLSRLSRWPQGFDENLFDLMQRIKQIDAGGTGLNSYQLRAFHRQLDRFEADFPDRQRLVLDTGTEETWKWGMDKRGTIEFYPREDGLTWRTSELGGAYNTTAMSAPWLESAIVRDSEINRSDYGNVGSYGEHWGTSTIFRGTVLGIPATISDCIRGHENGTNYYWEFRFATQADADRFRAALLEQQKMPASSEPIHS